MRKLMILGAGILQLPAIKKAKNMGLEVIAVDMDPHAIGFNEKDVICEVISTIDTENVLHAAKKHSIDGIMTIASDMPMRTVAFVAKELGLKGISEKTAYMATNKAEMMECFKQAGVPVPSFFKVNNEKDFKAAVNNFSDCCIVKPVDSSGSRGVVLFDDTSNAQKANRVYQYSKKYSKSGDVIVEEYMQGQEVSVESISINGICHVIQITDKVTTGAPYFVEMGHSQPSRLSKEIKERIIEITKMAVNAIGIKDGPSHTEIIVTNDGPKIVELGARLGGDNITTHLVPLSTGIDMVEATIKVALGDSFSLTSKWSKGAAIKYIKGDIGTIKEIQGLEEAQKVNNVCQISMQHRAGDKSDVIRNSLDRIGFIIAKGDTADEAINNCEKALNKINVVVE